MADDDAPTAIWVKSDISAAGTYIVSIEGGPDRSHPLDRDAAMRHAMAVLTAAQHADYDAAILAQYVAKMGMPIEDAAHLVRSLRADRPPVDPAAVRAHLQLAAWTDLPVYYVFEDMTVLTPHDVLITGRVGPHTRVGSGAPYYLIGSGLARPFDDIFGPQEPPFGLRAVA